MSSIVDSVENKREKSRNLLQNLLDEAKISIEQYSQFLEFNEKLSTTLITLITSGEMLVKNTVIEDLSKLFKIEERPSTVEQYYLKMKEIIIGPLGSHNAYIQRKAMSIAREISKSYGWPEDIATYDIYVPVVIKASREDEIKWHNNYYRHMMEVARAIYYWVADNIKYDSGPPDVWLKSALHTLIVGGGDCKDVTILLCSLWRSIGFITYMGFQPEHVYPGLILPKLRKAKVHELPSVYKHIIKLKNPKIADNEKIYYNEFVLVPGEFKFKKYQIELGGLAKSWDIFDLAFMGKEKLESLLEDFKKMRILLENELARDSSNEKTENELKKIDAAEETVRDMVAKFEDLFHAKIFYVDNLPVRG